jgi:hypothetical protein
MALVDMVVTLLVHLIWLICVFELILLPVHCLNPDVNSISGSGSFCIRSPHITTIVG